MIDYLLYISISLIMLSLLCYAFNIYGWRSSLLIIGIGTGILKYLIIEILGIIPDVNSKVLPLLFFVIVFFILSIIFSAIGTHKQEIEMYKQLGVIPISDERGLK